MLFNSYEFIFLFLPIVAMATRLASRVGGRLCVQTVLLVASVVFYSFAGLDFLAYLAASVAISFALSRLVAQTEGRRRSAALALAVALNVGALAVAKYNGFFVANVNRLFQTDWRVLDVAVPLGISFFTFSQIAYVVGVARRELAPASFLDYALYVFYFPKLLMGPIAEPSEFFANLRGRSSRIDWRQVGDGLRLFSFGLFKKTVFADAFSRTVAYGFGLAIYNLSTFDTIVLSLTYAFEIYFDFSGYTDMARGVSRILGIELPQNFDSPYKALSIRDFWKRWHITLTRFLTKYVYFPLGGSRRGDARTALNVLLVFLVSGIWHGANWTFVLWGVLHGLFMLRDRFLGGFDEKIPKVIRWCLAFAVVNLLWLLFRSADFSQFATLMANLASFRLTRDAALMHTVETPVPLWLLLPAALVVVLAFPNSGRIPFRPNWRQVLLTVAAAFVGICALSNSGSFVYFNF